MAFEVSSVTSVLSAGVDCAGVDCAGVSVVSVADDSEDSGAVLLESDDELSVGFGDSVEVLAESDDEASVGCDDSGAVLSGSVDDSTVLSDAVDSELSVALGSLSEYNSISLFVEVSKLNV